MQKEEFIAIAGKVSEGLATDQEKELFLYHLDTFAKENPEWEKLDSEFRQQIEAEIKSDIYTQIFGEFERKSKPIKLWPRIVTVAAAVALVVFGVYFFNYNKGGGVVNDVPPGSVGATLTLADGKKIRLTNAANGELAKEAGVVITKSVDGQLVYEIQNSSAEPNKINTLSTAKGETYRLRLPDGSLIWLNAASSLTYSANLNDRGKRRVKLEGEGYFEITKDKAYPFVVESKGQEVEVLGTHFNINSYDEQEIVKTTLLEGSVKVSVESVTKILKPGQEAVMKNSQIKVSDVEVEDAIAWKKGYFMFNSENLVSVMDKISRWYDVTVSYQDESIKQEIFFGTISKFEDVSKVLNMLERTRVVKFKVNGHKITVYKRN